jgi:hypothetical protein
MPANTSTTFEQRWKSQQQFTCPCGKVFWRFPSMKIRAKKNVPCCSRKCSASLVLKERPCLICNESYKPTSARQKWCTSCIPDQKARELYQRYGLTKQDWDRLYIAQGGKCAICKKAPVWAVDHCHKTGAVRGLLCGGCNVKLIGLERDQWMKAALEYLETTKPIRRFRRLKQTDL